MNLIVYILANVLIIGLFLYSKLTPYKDQLTGNYKKTFVFFDKLFTPILSFIKTLVKPLQVGNGIAVDMSQIILLFLILLIIKLLL